jgi:hypothetical protein
MPPQPFRPWVKRSIIIKAVLPLGKPARYDAAGMP